MRRSLLWLFALLPGTAMLPALHAADDLGRAPASSADVVRAATARAHASLYEQVAPLPLTADLTIADYLKHMDAVDEFQLELQRADQMGGPRWIDRNTCQVQLEISAVRVVQSLQRIAAARPQRSPVTPIQIARIAATWPDRMISATGSSASATALKDLRPRAGDAWALVSDAARQQALRDARAAAIRRSLDSIASVPLGDRQTIGTALENPAIARTIQEYLASRPVTRVDFRDDLQVEVVLSVDERDFFDELRSALISADVPLLTARVDQDRLWRDYLTRFRPLVGRAAVATGPMTRAVLFRAPAAAPEWTEQPLSIQGSAPIIGSKLRSAVRAETDARAKLRQRVESLELEKDLTIGQAARDHHRVSDIVYRFVKTARIYKTEYRPDGTVAVYLTADPADLWEDLRR